MSDSCKKLLTILNKFEQIPDVEEFVLQTASNWNIDPETINELVLSTEEIVSNIINYGFNDVSEDREINILMMKNETKISIIIKDDGMAFNPLGKENPDSIEKPVEEREAGGLGIYFVKELMDHVDYHHEGKFNLLTIEKFITKI
ncbi:MAG TPA: ATP-binding protein [Bacteroidales bacterium]|nr:ATP-binding protein [Bacteroidales bacterium]HPR58131.1 ATP-binding protein [Bacteroidales bacterium]HRW96786.1 ATP-binding protein [Bacteroidales bacterium]